MRPVARTGLGLAVWCALATPGDAGHEFPFYPSFYPQEIQIEVVDPPTAATRLKDGSLHAYVGPDPFAGAPPPNVSAIDSLGGYVVVTPSPLSAAGQDATRRCLAARRIVAGLRARSTGWTFHPYPVTPYHPDFLQHADLADAARQAYETAPAAVGAAPLQVGPRGDAALRLFGPAPVSDRATWDATVEVIEIADLVRPAAVHLNGWLGPPWLKAGSFHAYLLQARALTDPGARSAVEAAERRLITGSLGGDPVARLNLERALVSRLGEGCERVVAGYTLRREYVNSDYSGGVENVGADAQTGLLSPIFPRTAKLKDFPWNGWLTVGVPRAPAGPWNPVGGFDDPGSRLAWMALGDPAFFPAPHGGGWIPNRVTAAIQPGVAGQRPAIPPDALAPEPGSGRLRKVGSGKSADAQIRYRVLNSAFHDGTRMTVGDLVYPYVFAFRWAAPGSGDDPLVERSTRFVRERLAGLQVLRVETDVLAFGEDKLTYEVPVVDVYLSDVLPDPREAAALAPPWTTLPWHLLVLMEEAVTRGLAAFSRERAETRGVPVLDLVRDARLKEGLARILDDLAQRRHVPDALKDFATADEARERFAALKAFYAQHGHFLVTNGPYQLDQTPGSSTVLKVFRDLSYPRGVGAFDAQVIPLRAYVTRVERRGDRLAVHAEVEKVERYGREVKVVREPFSKAALEQDKRSLPLCHYVVVGPDRAIVKAGTVRATDPGTFVVDPATPGAKPGSHTVLIALSLDETEVGLPIKAIPWTP